MIILLKLLKPCAWDLSDILNKKILLTLILTFIIFFNISTLKARPKPKPTKMKRDIEMSNIEQSNLETTELGEDKLIDFSKFKDFYYGIDLIYINPELKFDIKLWKKINADEDISLYSEDYGFIPDISLGKDSEITISGRKKISFNISNKTYPYRSATEDNFSSMDSYNDFYIDQEMQVRVEGNIKNRFYIDINYDDTNEWEAKKNIKLSYLGTEDDIIQEIILGDINLTLPRTKFISFNKKLFGAKAEFKVGPVSYYAILSKEEGETSDASFKGNTQLTSDMISSSNYEKKFYNLKNVFDNNEFPIEDISIYYDDKNKFTNDENTIEVDLIIDGEDRKFYLDKLENVEDYLIKDEDSSIIEFDNSYDDGYLLITYRDSNGILHDFSNFNSEQLIYEVEERFSDARMKNKYFLGSNGLSIDETVVRIYDSADDEQVEVDGETYYYSYILGIDEDNDGYADSKFIDYEDGFLEFKYKKDGSYYINKKPFDFLRYIDGGTVSVSSLPDNLESIYNEVGEASFIDLLNQIDNSEIYEDFTNPRIYFYIHVRYFTPKQSYSLDHLDIIPGSEHVVVDGRELVKNKDYKIDYTLGTITFTNQDIINADSEIEINYEYQPIFASESKTLFGNRLELNLVNDFYIGSTYIRDWMPEQNLDRAPSFGDETTSHSVYGADIYYDYKGEEFNALIKGEFAQSNINPNTYGEVMLEDMENSEIETNISLLENNWLIASPPEGKFNSERYIDVITPRDFFDETYVELNEIDPDYGDQDKKIMKIENLPDNPGDFFSYVQRISNRGADFTNYEKIVFWYKLDGSSGDINIDLGIIDEDSDQDGILDTEDSNMNNTLDLDEDVGFDFNVNSDVFKIGSSNNRLDDEDLDGDGVLRTNEEVLNYKISLIGDNSWHKISIDLNNFESGLLDYLNLVKHIRLWGENFNGGSLEIANLDIVGTSWEVKEVEPETNTFEVKTISNYTDPDYEPLHDYNVDNSDTVVEDISLVMDFDMNDFIDDENYGVCEKNYGRGRDYTIYNKIKFAYYATEDISGTFDLFVRLATNENNYYEITKEVDSSDSSEWRYITVSDIKNINNNPDIEKVGEQANIKNIKYIYFGVKGDSTRGPYSGKIYVNDIKLYDPNIQKGQAKYLSADLSYKDYVSLYYFLESKDSKFSLIGNQPDNISDMTQRINANVNFGNMISQKNNMNFKTSINYINSLRESDNIINTQGNISNWGRTETDQYNISSKFSKNKWPNINYSYDYKIDKNTNMESPYYDEKITHYANLNYSYFDYEIFSVKFLPIDFNLKASEKLIRTFFYNSDDEYKNESLKIQDWTLDLEWEWVNDFRTDFQYDLTEKWNLVENEFNFKEKYFRFDNNYINRINQFVRLSLDYSTSLRDRWDLNVIEDSYLSSNYDFQRFYRGEIKFTFIELVKNINLFDDKFELTLEYSNNKELEFEDITKDYDYRLILGDESGLRDFKMPDYDLDKDNYFLNYNTKLFNIFDTKIEYEYSIADKQYKTNNFQTMERFVWPKISVYVRDFSNLPLFSNLSSLISYQNMRFKYDKVKSITKSTNYERETISVIPQFTWNISWKKNIQTEFSIYLNKSKEYRDNNEPTETNQFKTNFSIDYEFRTKKILKLLFSQRNKKSTSTLKLSYDFLYDEKWYTSQYENDNLKINNKISAEYSLANQLNFSGNFMYNIYRSDNMINSYNEFGFGVGFEIIF